MTHPNFTVTVLLRVWSVCAWCVWEADCSLSFLLKGAETRRFLHFIMLNAIKQANSHPNFSGEWRTAEGMRTKRKEEEEVLIPLVFGAVETAWLITRP